MIDQNKVKEEGVKERFLEIAGRELQFEDVVWMIQEGVWTKKDDCCIDWQNLKQWIEYTKKSLGEEL